MTRDAGRPAFPSPSAVGAGNAWVPAPTSRAPRRRSSCTAAWTCSSTGPSSTRFARAWSMGHASPTIVGLPASPQGPGPSSAAPIRVRRSAGTAARPAESTLQGSQSRSATDRTAGRAISASWVPSSSSSSRCRLAPRSSIRRTPLAKGRSSSSATSGPTCPVSPSMELRPSSTRSKGPAVRSAAARARAVASVSEPANASSQMCSPESAPQANASRRTSSASGGPRVTTVQEPPLWRASVTPCATARRQYGVHLGNDAVADQAPVLQVQRFGDRDLLDERGHAQRVTRGAGHCATLSARRGRDVPTRLGRAMRGQGRE